jgi:small subunit ribosomal protein S21
MLIVPVKKGNIERALKNLKKKVRNTKQKEELNSRKEYTKPSVKKRQEKKNAIHKQRKNLDD